MTLASAMTALACTVFVAAMLHVIVTDLSHRRIRNWLVAAMAALYAPLALAAGIPVPAMAAALLAALLVFVAGVGCFAAGWMGGGDVKLAAAIVLWLGAGKALPFLLLTSVIGGVLALGLIVAGLFRRERAGAAAAAAVAGAPETPVQRLGMPYGPALAIAGLVHLFNSAWVDAL